MDSYIAQECYVCLLVQSVATSMGAFVVDIAENVTGPEAAVVIEIRRTVEDLHSDLHMTAVEPASSRCSGRKKDSSAAVTFADHYCH